MGASEQGAQHTEGRWLTINRTLCFLRWENDVLLLRRSPTARIFPGRFNGVGGHIERAEDPLTCARREIFEETGLTVHTLHLRAIYSIDAGQTIGITVFVFVGSVETREIVDSHEGKLHWIPIDRVHEYLLVDDLYDVLPRVLEPAGVATPLFVQMRYNESDELVLQVIE